MTNLKQRIRLSETWQHLLLMTLVAGITFLPWSLRLTYHRDDWYFMLDAFTYGSKVFHYMFAIDRPGRGYLFDWLFSLFGMDPLPWHLSMFVWRLGSGFAAYWLMKLLWPQTRQAAFWMGTLFVIYPGFWWWIAGIEYLPIMISAGLQTLSIALSVYALLTPERGRQILAVTGALITGWGYVALVDYAVGLESFRWFCLLLVVWRSQKGAAKLLKTIGATLKRGWFYLSIPLGYLIWYTLFFENVRRETDIGAQLSVLVNAPLHTAATWLVNWLNSVTNLALFVWFEPFKQLFYQMRLRDMFLAILLASAVVIVIVAWTRLMHQKHSAEGTEPGSMAWMNEAGLLGLAGLATGILPVIMANRGVIFDRYSHYGLASSLPAGMLVVGVIFSIGGIRLRKTVLLGITFLAVITHFALGTRAMTEENVVRDLWWQMSWRATGLKLGTTLVVNYPGVYFGEDQDVTWGPANLIYAPAKQDMLPVVYPITAPPQNPDRLTHATAGDEVKISLRSSSMVFDYQKLLVIDRPLSGSCIHVQDARWPRISGASDYEFSFMATKSKIDLVETGGNAPELPEYLFGNEPERGWCYWYQQAEIAATAGNWEEIAGRLTDEINNRGLKPVDRVEWMPFLQAAAVVGDVDTMRELATKINDEKGLQFQACISLQALDEHGFPLPKSSAAMVGELFCR